MKTNLSETKDTLYVIAKATVPCSQFKAGEYVSVKFFHRADNGEAWYLINRSENTPSELPTGRDG